MMDRFLVEIPHDPDEASCKAAFKVFAETGSTTSHVLISGVRTAFTTHGSSSRPEITMKPAWFLHRHTGR